MSPSAARLLALSFSVSLSWPWSRIAHSNCNMGFSFKGLSSSALLSSSARATRAGHQDLAGVPASVHGHTSLEVARPDEKVGAPHTATFSDDSDEELNKIDTTAEAGVQAVQAASMLWTRRDLIIVYIMYVYQASLPWSCPRADEI